MEGSDTSKSSEITGSRKSRSVKKFGLRLTKINLEQYTLFTIKHRIHFNNMDK